MIPLNVRFAGLPIVMLKVTTALWFVVAFKVMTDGLAVTDTVGTAIGITKIGTETGVIVPLASVTLTVILNGPSDSYVWTTGCAPVTLPSGSTLPSPQSTLTEVTA